MRIAVIGATGRTGRRVVEGALGRGHEVAAVVRRPAAVETTSSGTPEVFVGDVLDPRTLVPALAGADSVISAIGNGSDRTLTEIYSKGVRNELAAMPRGEEVPLVVISAAPAGPRGEQPFLERRLIMPVLDRIFGETYEDMRRMETILSDQYLPWISVRPPRLIDREATGSYRLGEKPPPRGRSIRCADLATALLDLCERPDLVGRAVYVAN